MMVKNKGAKHLRRCPRCGSAEAVVPVVYGYPSPEMDEAAARGEMMIGGCLIGGEDPGHCCLTCRIEFDFANPEILDSESARRGWREWS
jgi:hypothetical protein